jgi:hypothetical protein
MKYQLFRESTPISKPHSTIEACIIEALEAKAILYSQGIVYLSFPFFIREVEVED